MVFTFDIESTFLCNPEDVSPNVGASCNEVHRILVILVPDKMIWRICLLQLFQCSTQISNSTCKHLCTPRDAPLLLILQTGIGVFAATCNWSFKFVIIFPYFYWINFIILNFVPSSGKLLYSNGFGGLRFFQRLSMLNKYLISSWNNLENSFSGS